MSRTALRRGIVTVIAAGIVLTGTPALADPGRPRPGAPACPPGQTAFGQGDPAEQSRTPTTGPINRITQGQSDCSNV